MIKLMLMSYSGHRLDTVGKVTLLVSTKDKYVPGEFELVKNKATPIFGLNNLFGTQFNFKTLQFK